MSKRSKKLSRRTKGKNRTKQALFASVFIIIAIAVTAYLAYVPPFHTLTVNSDPIAGVEFTVDGETHSTNWFDSLNEGDHTIIVPSTWMNGSDLYNFVEWEDASTNPTRIVSLAADTTATAWYITSEPSPTGTLVIHTIDELTDGPLSEMTIGLVGPYEYDEIVQSNEQGEYMFESIPVGTYLVAAWDTRGIYHTDTGSQQFPIGVDIEAEETTHITIRLHGHN